MARWEYRVEILDLKWVSKQSEDLLNKLGGLGWECFAVIVTDHNQYERFYFKRKVE